MPPTLFWFFVYLNSAACHPEEEVEEEEDEEEEEEGIPLVLPPSRQQLHTVWKAISDHEYADPFR